MAETVVKIERLSKKYIVRHEDRFPSGHGFRHLVQEALVAPLHAFARARRPVSRRMEDRRPQDFWALKDVSFEVKRGEVLGIIGRNGAGKSTLLKILSRITEPTGGRAGIKGRVASLLEIGTGFHPELTGRENVYLNGAILGMGRSEVRRRFDEIVDFAGVESFLDIPIKRYSSGMHVRLAFSVAAHLEPEILIVDEVLSVGDAAFQERCLGKLRDAALSGERTVLFVSHNMAAVRTLCGVCAFLKNGRLEMVDLPQRVIAAYMGEGASGSARFERGPLRSVKVMEDNGSIRIDSRFDSSIPIDLPCLGFAIHDGSGNPVCGSNPRVSGMRKLAVPLLRGVVKVVIRQPKLLDGRYLLSVWFGNTAGDMVFHPHCASFDVAGAAGPRQLNPALAGSVLPQCEWEFSGEVVHPLRENREVCSSCEA